MKIFNLIQTWFNDDYMTVDEMFATRVVVSTKREEECVKFLKENFEKYKGEGYVSDLDEISEQDRDVIFYDETTDDPIMRMEIIESDLV